MTNNDRKQFAALMAGLAVTLREALDEAGLEAYWMALNDLEMVAFRRAVTVAARTLKFFPKAVELRELAGEVGLSQRAILAFDCVNRAIETLGAYKSVAFDDPAINAAIRAMGGWPELCSCEHDEFHSFKAAQFEKYYKAFAQAGVTAEQGAPLAGYFERENRLHGYAVDPPARFETGLPPLGTALRVTKEAKPLNALPAMDLPRLELQRP